METPITIPIVELDNKTWILLKHISSSWTFRAMAMDKHPKETHEQKSHHKVFEIKAEGSVRCTPNKQWDILNYQFEKTDK